MFLGSIGRDFEFYYDPKDFYKNLPDHGKNFKVPMSNPWRLQTNIVFYLGGLSRSDSKYLNNEENFPCHLLQIVRCIIVRSLFSEGRAHSAVDIAYCCTVKSSLRTVMHLTFCRR